MKRLTYSLLWALPIINYLWSIILNMTPNLPFDYIAQQIKEEPPIYATARIIVSILLIIILYSYLLVCYIRIRHGKPIKLVTISWMMIQTASHVAMYVYTFFIDYNDHREYALYINAFWFFHSLLYFIPFYLLAFYLFKKIELISKKQNKGAIQ
mgnify:FL=1